MFVFRRIRQKTNLLTSNLLSANHAIIHFIEYPVKTVSHNLSVCAAIHTACHALHKLHRRLCDLHTTEPTTHLKAHMQHTAVSFLKTVFCLKQKPLLYKVKQYPVFPQVIGMGAELFFHGAIKIFSLKNVSRLIKSFHLLPSVKSSIKKIWSLLLPDIRF